MKKVATHNVLRLKYTKHTNHYVQISTLSYCSIRKIFLRTTSYQLKYILSPRTSCLTLSNVYLLMVIKIYTDLIRLIPRRRLATSLSGYRQSSIYIAHILNWLRSYLTTHSLLVKNLYMIVRKCPYSNIRIDEKDILIISVWS